MSGGLFEYKDSSAQNEIFHFADEPTNVFEDIEISRLVWDVFELIHDFDWYKSGDTDESDWLKSKAEFKKKWFHRDETAFTKEIIDEEIAKAKEALYKTFLPKGD